MDLLKHKKILFNYCNQLVFERLDTCKKAIDDAKEANEQETKSTAGDKHETGRAMIQLELEKFGKQMREWEQQKLFLTTLNTDTIYEYAVKGSIVTTNRGNFYLAIASGKYTIGDSQYFIISVESPIAKELLNRKAGESFRFNNYEYIIKNIS